MYTLTGSTQEISRSGRPTIITTRVLLSFKKNIPTNMRNSTIAVTSKLAECIHQTVSTRSVKRGLKRIGYSSCTATHKPLISKLNQVRRTTFARDMLKWESESICQVICSGESRFTQFRDDGRKHV